MAEYERLPQDDDRDDDEEVEDLSILGLFHYLNIVKKWK